MRGNMFGLRLTMDCHPRSKNGQPPHSTTGVARISSSQITARAEIRRPMGPPGIMSPIARKKNCRCQDRAHPEAPRHVSKLDVLVTVERDDAGFQGHATDRARSGSTPHD